MKLRDIWQELCDCVIAEQNTWESLKIRESWQVCIGNTVIVEKILLPLADVFFVLSNKKWIPWV